MSQLHNRTMLQKNKVNFAPAPNAKKKFPLFRSTAVTLLETCYSCHIIASMARPGITAMQFIYKVTSNLIPKNHQIYRNLQYKNHDQF